MTFVRLGDKAVPHHVRVTGSGPVCVLSAGLGLAWFDWDPVVELLAPWRTVVRFDRPGAGLSGHARVPPTLAGEAERIARVLDAVGLPGPATVVGHSLAGFHCEAFARLFPARTSGLVLADSSVEERPGVRIPRGVRVGAARLCGAVLSGAGLPRAIGPVLRRAAVRGEAASAGAVPGDVVRRVYGASRVLRGSLLEYATYGDLATELTGLRREYPLREGLPVTVLAAYSHGTTTWLTRQRNLAASLGAAFRVARPSGHLVMRDAARSLAEAILDTAP
ncbi:alpha/beta fold hydrolase [Streptomyces longisporoflavus]|uniref:Alpha/beta fold hydrolase n=1 Tax=Streptomyces longisporoflavus TaxID=28044 RepID=A0ABW7QM63_9ACTN